MKPKAHLGWLRANGHATAALTGTDARALAAIAACWELYPYERCGFVLDAVALLLESMQPKTRPLAFALIPWAMDWSDEAPVRARVERAIQRRADARPLSNPVAP